FSLRADPDAPWMPEVSGAGQEVLPNLLRGNIMTVNAPMWRRLVFERAGFFDEGLAPIQDWDYWIRCAMAGARFQFFDAEDTLALIRIHSASASTDERKMLDASLRVRSKIAGIVHQEDLLAINRKYAAVAARYSDLGHAIAEVCAG